MNVSGLPSVWETERIDSLMGLGFQWWENGALTGEWV